MNDEAFDLLVDFQAELERNQALRPREPWYFQDEIRTSALLMPLHSDPRWTELTDFPG